MRMIDGSAGEGGGQILRTSLALSLITGQPFCIDRIRAGRRKPGLLAQHLAAVQAAAQVGNATVRGASLGSARLEFAPRDVAPGGYEFHIDTAGSAMLVLQTVLPPLMTAHGPSVLRVTGGTHNPHAPPFEFLVETFLPQVARLGPRVSATLQSHGFFPAGGGDVTMSIEPSSRLTPSSWLQRGDLRTVRVLVVVSGLPATIAERELDVARAAFGSSADYRCLVLERPRGPGNVLLISLEFEQITEVLAGFGERGVRAEDVARNAIADVRRIMDSAAAVGPNLADQLLLPMALAGEGVLRTCEVTPHAHTNMDVIARFLKVRFEVAQTTPDFVEIRVVRAD